MIGKVTGLPHARWSTRALVCALGCAYSCVVGGTFVCEDDGQCPSGRCEPSGFCSFPDDGCASGHRYSEWAGDDLAESCAAIGTSSESTGDGALPSDSSGVEIAVDLGPAAERDPSLIACGNGVLELDEACDDGNAQDGDGCNHDCVISGTPLWTVIEDGPNSGEDYANAVAMLPGGDPVVAGRYGANAGDLFVKAYAGDDGELAWSKLYGTALTEEARALVADDARVLTAGFAAQGANDGGDDLFTRAYVLDLVADPEVGWTRTFDSSIGGDDRVTALALRPDREELVVLGFVRGPDDITTHVRAYATVDGASRWAITPDVDPSGAQLQDQANGAVVTADGRMFVVGSIVDPGRGGRSDGWLAELDVATSPDGVAFGTPVRIGTGATVDLAAAIAEAPDGTLLVAGHRDQRAFWSRYDRDLLLLEDYVPDPISACEIVGIAVDATGAIVTVGYTTTAAHGSDIEVIKYVADGTRLWRDRVDGSAGLDERARAIAIAQDDTIVVVGNIRETVTGSDLWIRKYAP